MVTRENYARRAKDRPVGQPARLTLDDLTVTPPGDLDLDSLLDDWRWLVGPEYQALGVTALGDMFVMHEDGRCFLLDVGNGTLGQIAEDAIELQDFMTDMDFVTVMLIPHLVGDLWIVGKKLGPGQCFSPDKPHSLGGAYSVNNYQPCDLRVHFSLFGQLQKQVRDLPPGTRIDDVVFGA